MSDFNTLGKIYWEKTVVEEVYMSRPLFAKMKLREVLEVSGKELKGARRTSTGESRMQAYDENTIVEAQATDDKAVYNFQWKFLRLPILVTDKEMKLTRNMMEVSMDFVADKLSAAQEDARIYFAKRLLGLDGALTDSGTSFQGLREALTHDLTYGGVTRGTTVTNPTWQGASLADTYADQATVYPASINTVRLMALKIEEHSVPKPGSKLLIVGPLPWMELKGQVEAQTHYPDPGPLFKFGFQSFMIDDIEVVMDNYLQEKHATGASRWSYMLNMDTWTFRVHPDRNFELGPWVDQETHLGGKAVHMALLKVWGNCYCTKPNGNIWVPKFGS